MYCAKRVVKGYEGVRKATMSGNMAVIITMAGMGSRFREAGYDCPKYRIEACGKTLFEWSMDSLLDFFPHITQCIFVVRKEDRASGFIRAACRKYGVGDPQIIEIDQMTDGQATTALLAVPYCQSDEPVLIYNIDTYVEPGGLRYEDISGDGYIPCFHAPGEHWSFVRTDGGNRVLEVREKKRISDHCTLGAYYFSSAWMYRGMYEEYYMDDGHMEKGEKYIAPMYNHMIQKGIEVKAGLVSADMVHVLGTPEELAAFIKHQRK